MAVQPRHCADWINFSCDPVSSGVSKEEVTPTAKSATSSSEVLQGGHMDRRHFLYGGTAAVAVALVSPDLAFAETGEQILRLPQPDKDGGKPLMTCLARRRTSRSLSHEDVDLPTLSGLLWAAWGVNRDNGKHVVPTAMDKRQVLVYAVRGNGVWEYMPGEHSIKRVLDGDRRGDFDGAGLILLYVAPKGDHFAPMHVGSIYQNVGLYCASAGLANCVKYHKRGAIDAHLSLPANWETYIAHSVARPAR